MNKLCRLHKIIKIKMSTSPIKDCRIQQSSLPSTKNCQNQKSSLPPTKNCNSQLATSTEKRHIEPLVSKSIDFPYSYKVHCQFNCVEWSSTNQSSFIYMSPNPLTFEVLDEAHEKATFLWFSWKDFVTLQYKKLKIASLSALKMLIKSSVYYTFLITVHNRSGFIGFFQHFNDKYCLSLKFCRRKTRSWNQNYMKRQSLVGITSWNRLHIKWHHERTKDKIPISRKTQSSNNKTSATSTSLRII